MIKIFKKIKTKNINHPLNDNIDIYKEDNKNKGMKYLEKETRIQQYSEK